MSRAHWILVLALTSVASTSFAQSLKDKKEIASADKTIKEKVDEVNAACGSTISATVNYKSFKFDDSYGHGSAANYCGTILDGIRQVCESGETEKKAVKDSVKKVNCEFTAKMETKDLAKKGMKIVKGTVTATYSWKTGNLADGSKEFLMSAL